MFHIAKLHILCETLGIKRLQKYFEVVDAEDAAVADFAAFAGGQYLDIAPAAVKIVSQGDTISEFQDRAVGFPYGNIDRIAGVEHGAGRSDMNRTCHYLNVKS